MTDNNNLLLLCEKFIKKNMVLLNFKVECEQLTSQNI